MWLPSCDLLQTCSTLHVHYMFVLFLQSRCWGDLLQIDGQTGQDRQQWKSSGVSERRHYRTQDVNVRVTTPARHVQLLTAIECKLLEGVWVSVDIAGQTSSIVWRQTWIKPTDTIPAHLCRCFLWGVCSHCPLLNIKSFRSSALSSSAYLWAPSCVPLPNILPSALD